MRPYKHHMPVDLTVGRGILHQKKRYKLPYSHVLLVVKEALDETLKKTLDMVIEQLKQQKISVTTFANVSHPLQKKHVLTVIDLAKTHDVDAVMAFGGGKTMDLAKLVSRFKLEDPSLLDAWLNSYTRPPFEHERLPLIMMPTTFNIASGVSNKAFIHQENKQQYFRFKDQSLFPDQTWLDLSCFETHKDQGYIETFLNMFLRGVELLLDPYVNTHEQEIVSMALSHLIEHGVYVSEDNRPQEHLAYVMYGFLMIASRYIPKTKLPLHQISDAIEGYHESLPYSAFLAQGVLPYLSVRLSSCKTVDKLKALFEHTVYHNNNLYVAFENFFNHLSRPSINLKQHGVDLALVSDYIIHLKTVFPYFESLSDEAIYTIIEQTLLS